MLWGAIPWKYNVMSLSACEIGVQLMFAAYVNLGKFRAGTKRIFSHPPIRSIQLQRIQPP